MVLLVLKLLVSSHPLELLKGPSIYVLLHYKGQAEYHFIMFLLCSRQSLYFSMHFIHCLCLNCFSCFSMITKFYCCYIYHVYVSYYDPISLCFYILLDQDCVTACHLKKYLFVITYLLGTSRS